MRPSKWRAMDESKLLVIANEVMYALDRQPRNNPKLTDQELLSIVKEYTGDNTLQLIEIHDAVSYLKLKNAVDVESFMGTVPPAFDSVKISIEGRANIQVNRKWPIPKERAQEIEYSDKRPIRVFLSYSDSDLSLIHEIKKKLDFYCLETFLAHDDIEPSEEWVEEIILNLKECDVFIPFISENFKKSKWTDQESGIAFTRDKFIIPINIGLVPYGFIGKYQALPYENSSDACEEIIETMMNKNPLMKKRIQYDLNKKLEDSRASALPRPRILRIQLTRVFGNFQDIERMEGIVNEEVLFASVLGDYNINRTEASKLIGILMRDGKIYSPNPGYYKKR